MHFSTQDKLVYHRQMTFGFDASSNQSSPFDIYHLISTHYFTAFPHNACIVESTTNTCGCKGLIWQYLNCRMSTLYIIMTVMKYPSCMVVLFKLILKSKFCHCHCCHEARYSSGKTSKSQKNKRITVWASVLQYPQPSIFFIHFRTNRFDMTGVDA